MMRPIHPGLAPNVRKKDAMLALREIFKPWNYLNGSATKNLENWFEKFYREKAYAFSSGRGALYAILVGLGLHEGDEVLVEAFTCVAVVDAILATGAKPIYVDIQKDFTIDVADAEKKLTSRTKAILVQHTFAIPNNKKELNNFVKKYKLPLIEDVAHGIGIVDNKERLGSFGVAALFSFGRDKAFSAVSGGMVITKDEALSKKLAEFQQNQGASSHGWVFQNLFHMISFYFLILPLYDFLKIGKVFLVIFQNLGLLSKPIDKDELKHFSLYTKKLAPSLAKIALLQLQSLHEFNKRREEIVLFYKKNIKENVFHAPERPLLRFPVYTENPRLLKTFMRKHNIYVGDWYSNVIDPKDTDIYSLFYKKGSCPTAEMIASHIVNLPTYPLLTDAEMKKVVTLYGEYANKRNNK